MSAIVSDSERSLVYVNPIPDHARRVTIQVLGRLFTINHRVDVSLRNMTHGGASNELTKKNISPTVSPFEPFEIGCTISNHSGPLMAKRWYFVPRKCQGNPLPRIKSKHTTQIVHRGAYQSKSLPPDPQETSACGNTRRITRRLVY